jgi:hypothetical protein
MRVCALRGRRARRQHEAGLPATRPVVRIAASDSVGRLPLHACRGHADMATASLGEQEPPRSGSGVCRHAKGGCREICDDLCLRSLRSFGFPRGTANPGTVAHGMAAGGGCCTDIRAVFGARDPVESHEVRLASRVRCRFDLGCSWDDASDLDDRCRSGIRPPGSALERRALPDGAARRVHKLLGVTREVRMADEEQQVAGR